MTTPPSTRHRASTRRRRALWCEFLPLAELRSPALLGALASRGLALRVAISPGAVGEVAPLIDACTRAGGDVGLWPLLNDADGRWASCENAARFSEHARAVAAEAERGGDRPAIALDLEPPIGRVREALSGRIVGLRAGRGAYKPQAARLVALVGELRARGHRVDAAAIPAVVADARAPGWQRALGTPVDELSVDGVSVMLYSTLIEGYSRGALRRADARAVVRDLAAAAGRRFGPRAEVSLGVVAGGALGDERGYRAPIELADDMALARAAGIDALALYGLDGIVARSPIEAWLDVFASAPGAAPPAQTWRARAATRALWVASPALAALFRP